MNGLLLVPTIATSFALIGWLWLCDPKRRRVARLPAVASGANLRRGLAVAALLPGIVLAGLGDSAAFLVWLGSCAMAGWVLTHFHASPGN